MYRLKDLMMMFDLPERTIRRHLRIGLLRGKKVGGAWRFSDDDLARYLDDSEIRKSSKKRSFARVNDFINGFSGNQTDVLVSYKTTMMDRNQLKELSLFVSSFENAFSFDVNEVSNKHNLIFIGNRMDAVKLLERLGEKDD